MLKWVSTIFDKIKYKHIKKKKKFSNGINEKYSKNYFSISKTTGVFRNFFRTLERRFFVLFFIGVSVYRCTKLNFYFTRKTF